MRAAIVMGLALGPLAAPSLARAQDEARDQACFDDALAGQHARRAGKLGEARAAYLRCAQVECPAEVTRRCTAWTAEVDEAMPTILVAAEDSEGRDLSRGVVRVDGKELSGALEGKALTLDPGEHVVELEVQGAAPARTSVVVRENEKNRRVVLRLPAPPRRSFTKAPLVLGVAAAACVAAFGVLAAVATSDRQRSRCDVGCGPSDYDRVRAELTAADLSLGLGAVLAIAAVVDWLLETRASSRSQASAPPRMGAALTF